MGLAANPAGVEATYSIAPLPTRSVITGSFPAGATITLHPSETGVNDTTITVLYNFSFSGGAIQVSANGYRGTGTLGSLNITARLLPGTPGAITTTQLQNCPDRIYRYSSSAYNAGYYQWTVPSGGTIKQRKRNQLRRKFGSRILFSSRYEREGNRNP